MREAHNAPLVDACNPLWRKEAELLEERAGEEEELLSGQQFSQARPLADVEWNDVRMPHELACTRVDESLGVEVTWFGGRLPGSCE